MLTPELVDKLKKGLETKKAEITRELLVFTDETNKSTGNFDTVFPNYGDHPDENAQEVNSYEDMLPVEYTLEKDLANINRALEKIEKNIYGVCDNCGQAIDVKRLEVFPEAAICIQCANKR